MASILFSYVAAGLCVAVVSVLLLRRPTTNTDPQPPYNEYISIRLARLANELPSSHQTLTLADGRLLGYAVYGVPTGPTVFFLHGFGDCRLTGALFDQPAKELGVCVIGIDRPGCGLSSAYPGRTALDFAEDLRQLAAHLELDSYSILGVSGGGPYVLACAYSLPADQLKSVSMLCATGPWDMTMRHSHWATWFGGEIKRRSPTLVRWMGQKSMAKYRDMTPEQFIAAAKSRTKGWLARLLGPHENDIALLQNDDLLALVFEGVRENCRRGVEGPLEEWRIMTTSDLGFRLEDIRKDLSIDLWYGRHDTNVSWRIGEALQKRIWGEARLTVREETHLGILVNCRTEALGRLVEGIQRGDLEHSRRMVK